MDYGPADAVDVASLRRALVVQLRHHGDVLLTSPLLSVLKHRAPALEIDALVYSDTRDMIDLHPAVAQVHVVGRDWKGRGALARLAQEWRLFGALRARRYDLLIHLSEHPRGAWLARALGTRVAVAPDFERKDRRWKSSFTHLVRLPAHARRHRVEINLDALRRIGIQPGDAPRRLVRVSSGNEHEPARRVAGSCSFPEETRSAASTRCSRIAGSPNGSSCISIRDRAGSSSAGRPSARRR